MTKTTIEIPDDVQVLCEVFNIEPEDLLEQFLQDLCSLPGNGGSDERRMAKEYFLRGGIASNGIFSDYDEQETVLHSFEALYQKHYPSIENKTHENDRATDLEKLRIFYGEVKQKGAQQ